MADDRSSVRIACLLPSATDICVALGLADNIVGVTHECRQPSSSCLILTRDGVHADSSTQAQIHQCVVEAAAASSACSTKNSRELQQQGKEQPPSLYPILTDAFYQARPTVVLTQDLCQICAPSSASVQEILLTCNNSSEGSNENVETPIKVLSQSPQSLMEVADSFEAVAEVCNVPKRGLQLKTDFLQKLQNIHSALEPLIQENKQPRVLILEWLDPPFDAGHWLLDMIEMAVATSALGANSKSNRKSQQITWESVEQAEPDVVLVTGCGFDLQRNLRDARSSRDLASFMARHPQTRIYCVNANEYFVKPGPALVLGTVILARCAHDNNPAALQALHELDFVQDTEFWNEPGFAVAKLNSQPIDLENTTVAAAGIDDNSLRVPDIEDFYRLHENACQRGDEMYTDPKTGYMVFTKLAHLKRGNCCGSGCRHCPYGHENLKDKTRIQQPSILVESTLDLLHTKHGNLRILFWSGGKDSFLTLRALVRQRRKQEQNSPFGVVLLTTYDTTSRMIAHQDVSLDNIIRQAQHLGLALVAVPFHRGSSEMYVDRIQYTLQTVFERQRPTPGQDLPVISALVFGDLHLPHIVQWRKDQLGGWGYDLEFPLLHVDYSQLQSDLWASQVPCVISSSTVVPLVQVGDVFNATLIERIDQENSCGNDTGNGDNKRKLIDVFGECGEFHTLAQVWLTDRIVALGLDL